MEPMQVLLITHEYPPFKGGIGNYSQGVAKALVRSGHRVVVLTVARSGMAISRDHGEDDPEVIEIRRPKGPKWWRLVRLTAAYRKILRSHQNYRVHCLDTESWRIMNLVNLVGNCSFSLTVHGSDVLSTSRSVRVRFLGMRSLFKGVFRVLAVSTFTRDLFLERFSYFDRNRVAVANPAPSEDMIRLSRIFSGVTRPSQPNLRILTVARLDPRKGHLNAFTALQELVREQGTRIEWIIVGDPVDKEYHEVLLCKFSDATFPITVCGGLGMEELAEEYRKADLFLLAGDDHPKRVEGFGMVYLEAGLFGLPSVGTLVGGTGEAVVDGVTGLMCRPGDMPTLLENLKTLVLNTGLRKKMGIAAREHAFTFNWERTASATFPDLNEESI